MKDKIIDYFNKSIRVKNDFLKNHFEKIEQASDKLVSTFQKGNKVLIFGNGGSAADSQHFAAELVGRFRKDRQAFPVLALTTNTSTLTAVANDYSFEDVFVKQLEAFLKPGDVVIAISTSGHSKNVVKAAKFSKERQGFVISFTGGDGGELAKISDLVFIVPADETSIIQEVHIILIHLLCLLIEEEIKS